jgi:SAM-dependent methyltransferase
MDPADRAYVIRRYEKLFDAHGVSVRAQDAPDDGRQEVRFQVLAEMALQSPECSVLDVGCGFADLYAFLRERGWHGRYTGVDLVPHHVTIARERHQEIDVRLLDFSEEHPELGLHDFVIASGVFSTRLSATDNAEHTRRCLRLMLARSREAIAANFLSSRVDYQKPESWHTDPAWAIGVAQELSRRVLLRHDYMPFEFSLFVYRDDSISPRKLFAAFEKRLPGAPAPNGPSAGTTTSGGGGSPRGGGASAVGRSQPRRSRVRSPR